MNYKRQRCNPRGSQESNVLLVGIFSLLMRFFYFKGRSAYSNFKKWRLEIRSFGRIYSSWMTLRDVCEEAVLRQLRKRRILFLRKLKIDTKKKSNRHHDSNCQWISVSLVNGISLTKWCQPGQDEQKILNLYRNLALCHLSGLQSLIFDSSERIWKYNMGKIHVLCPHSGSAPSIT